MHVAITGGTGFIGAHLVRSLVTPENRVRCLLRPNSDRSQIHRDVECVFTNDLTNMTRLTQLCSNTDAVVHVAGLTRSRYSNELFRVNHRGTSALIAAYIRTTPTPKQLIIVSSQAAVGPSTEGHIVSENDRPSPITAYGRSKLASETIVKRYPDLPITIIRAPAVYGPGDRDIFHYFRLIRAGIRLELVPDSKLSVIYVGNLVDAILLALKKPQSQGYRIYHVADHKVTTMSTIAQWIATFYGCRTLRIPVPKKALHFAALPIAAAGYLFRRDILLNRDKLREIKQHSWVFDTKKIQSELKYQPRTVTREGVQKTAQWYLDQGWLS